MVNKRKLKGWKGILSLMLAGTMLFGGMPAVVYAQEEEQESFDVQVRMVDEEIENISEKHDVMALVYMCDSYEVKKEASHEAETVAVLESGHTVIITGMEAGENSIWYQVRFGKNDVEYTGYIQKGYLAFSDEKLIRAEEELLEGVSFYRLNSSGYTDIDYFPVSYRKYLTELKEKYPDWTFVPMNTGLDWNEVVVNQMYQDRSLVPSSSDASWIRGYYSNSWSLASEEIVKHFLDPRNYLNEINIFAFEQLTYNAQYHTEAAVQNILNSTFMAGEIPGEGRSYANAFWEIGNSLGVSPFHLACRVYQEQGKGTSPLISGTYPGFEGLYNYFNVGASGSDNETIYRSGLTTARNYGWTSRFASLYGGAQVISKNYILKGQDTLYLQKFDVDDSYHGLYAHQYMQNIMAPQSESSSIRKAYVSAGSVDNPFVFKIPVYNNMPASRCVKPGEPEEPADEEIVPGSREAVSRFVTRLYTIALGRNPDTAGLNSWVDMIVNKEITGAEAAYGFIFSTELADKNLNNVSFVETLYRTFFGREADEGGRNGWAELLDNGLSREYVFKGFVDSEEFVNLCTEYGIDKGSIELSQMRDQNEGITRFVARCYRKALEREFEDEGLENWCRVLVEGSNTPKEVAQAFIFSEEFREKNLDNESYIRVLYQTFLDREPDDAGLASWIQVLESGEEDRTKVLEGFADSGEFADLMENYGLN